MNSRKLLSVLLLIFTFSACAWNANDTETLLWKISGNGLTAPSYIFGTHHFIPLSFLDSIKGIEKAFDASEQIIGELDMRSVNEMQMKLMSAAIMPLNYDYDDLLKDDEKEILDTNLMKILGIGLDQLSRMKPAMLQNLVSITLYQKYYPTATTGLSMDQFIQEKASRESKPVLALETPEDQIYALLDHQSIERQTELLMCMINNQELLKKHMDKLQKAYLNQDLQALYQLYDEEVPNDPCPSTQQEKDVLNKDRNEKWLHELPILMQQKSSFVAVGCLHLVGPDGLLEGLRKQGYSVEPIR